MAVRTASPPPPRRPIAPAARARARELGLDVEALPGTGPGGRVTREDVDAFAAARARLRAGADGVALEVPTQGAGDPVVLLPGFGTDVSSFVLLAPALSWRFALLGVNPRGVGLSEAPALPAYDVATAAADVAALAPRRFHAIGASLGAAVALELALRHPERVERLVLVTPFVAAGPRLLAVLELWTRAAAETSAGTLARILLPWLFSERFLADEGARERTARGLAQSVSRVSAAALARTAAGLRAWSGTRAGDLGRVAAPTLVVEAGADLLTPDAARVAAAIPGARLVRVPESGHAVGLEAPQPVNEAVLAHLGSP
jgi:pimeloyl-ACP methyl ester carboxylesterase